MEIREALRNSLQVIIDTIKEAMDEVPPEVLSDLLEEGVCLSGGGSQLLGLADRLTDELKVRVWVAEDPMTCVARGAGLVLEDLDGCAQYLVGLERKSPRG